MMTNSFWAVSSMLISRLSLQRRKNCSGDKPTDLRFRTSLPAATFSFVNGKRAIVNLLPTIVSHVIFPVPYLVRCIGDSAKHGNNGVCPRKWKSGECDVCADGTRSAAHRCGVEPEGNRKAVGSHR